MATDTSTIIGVFDRYSTAEQAARRLEDLGIPRQAIQINSEVKTEAAGRSRIGDEGDSGGGVSGFFRRLFGADTPEEHIGHLTNKYADVIGRGGAIVCATAVEADVDQAVDILNQMGAIDVDERSADSDGARSNATTSEKQQVGSAGSRTAIPVIEEELQVGKRVTRRGGVRVYSQVVEKPVEEQLGLREEHVRVERRPVDRPVNPDDESALREQSFEVTETAEEPVVNKRRRVKEEVVVGKEASERKETIRDTLKHTEVNVEPIGDAKGKVDYSDDFRRDYTEHYAASGVDYASIQPAYEYGYSMANDPRYKGKSWDDVQSTLETDYLRRSPNSSWDKVNGAVRYGWEKVTGKR